MFIVDDFNYILHKKDERDRKYFRVDWEIKEFQQFLRQTRLLDVDY